MMRQVLDAIGDGELDRARDIFDAYLPMMRYESQPGLGLAIRKYTLARQGLIAHSTLRKPGPSLSAAAKAEIDAIADRQKKRLTELGL
jgi:4-hydroxy-tetrahydrodipicolinate synthase